MWPARDQTGWQAGSRVEEGSQEGCSGNVVESVADCNALLQDGRDGEISLTYFSQCCLKGTSYSNVCT